MHIEIPIEMIRGHEDFVQSIYSQANMFVLQFPLPILTLHWYRQEKQDKCRQEPEVLR